MLKNAPCKNDHCDTKSELFDHAFTLVSNEYVNTNNFMKSNK